MRDGRGRPWTSRGGLCPRIHRRTEGVPHLGDSSLVAATGFVHELMWRSVKVGRAQFHNLEALIMAAIFYWVMTLLLTAVQSRLEARLGKGDR